ncbi:MFS transporter [Calothrix sp. NIES-3974]|uniref:MFS transporter n=1 Tax=Calothrix sp. NIES-3974 TaxID=2005462 RepID=UPI000B5DD8CB|nr:MFS transporter [Calothrix sp. NIES-3974]BAZ05263.1 hypothetical protein NIES3974_19090 [Calothrix sp. NIES-3974]
MDSAQIETPSLAISGLPPTSTINSHTSSITLSSPSKAFSSINHKSARTSLRASTIDAVFAVVFGLATSGILLNNFLLELGAGAMVFGTLSAIPMVVHACQPIGAYFSERVSSRFSFAIWTYGVSRSLWIILAVGIVLEQTGKIESGILINLTIGIVLLSHFLGSLGNPSWLSWMAMIVPRRLRGRYFGIRNSVASLTNLICVPIAGFIVSHWYGGTRAGFGVVLGLGIVCGIISLGCQYFKRDINPQVQNSSRIHLNSSPVSRETTPETPETPLIQAILADTNFMTFLVYVGVWMFAVSLSNPFFQLYMLDTLNLNVGWVTVYTSVQAAATLILMIFWGRLADRIGNRSILFFVGILMAIIPVFWLGVGQTNVDLWLWLPLLHIFTGGTGAAIELCTNNLQLGIAPIKNQAKYFAVAAAVTGVCGACGTTLGGFIASHLHWGGLPGLFLISAAVRMLALTPLLMIQEPQRQSVSEILQGLMDRKFSLVKKGI